MANLYGPRIVTDGLVLHLDAGNRKSYPLSGNTIYDLSGNGNNGIFGASTAAPTFSGDNGGVLSFDGSNDYVNAGNNSSLSFTNNLTIQVWCSSNISDNGYRTPLMKTTSTAWSNGYGFYQVSGNFYFFINQWNGAQTVSVSKTTFTLTSFVATYDGANLKLYENGILRQTGSSFTSNVSNSATNLEIGRGSGVNNYVWNGNIAQVSIYNKALSANEVQQNYNALKGRFGL